MRDNVKINETISFVKNGVKIKPDHNTDKNNEEVNIPVKTTSSDKDRS